MSDKKKKKKVSNNLVDKFHTFRQITVKCQLRFLLSKSKSPSRRDSLLDKICNFFFFFFVEKRFVDLYSEQSSPVYNRFMTKDTLHLIFQQGISNAYLY